MDADELLNRFETLETYASATHTKEKPLDHLRNTIPDFAREELIKQIIPHDDSVSLYKVINNDMGINEVGGKLASVIVKGFKLIHMNEDHPEYWNVILWNISLSSVYVFKDGRWTDQPFKEWADEFAKFYIARIILDSEGMDVWIECCQRCYEAISHSAKEIQEGLKSALRDPMLRTLMKARMACNK